MRKKFNKSRVTNRKGKPIDSKKRSKYTKDEIPKDLKEYESNDASWYTGDSTLTFDAGRFNWYYPNGTLIDGIFPEKFSFSGLLAMRVIPGVGVSLGGDSVVNTAARKLYTWIRRSKSSYATYDPSDLMQYCIAMSQAYQFHNWMCRIYGFLNLYSQVNRYLPDTLIKANGIDPDAIRGEMSDFLFYINKFGSQLSSLAAPATLPYFKRQAWLYSSVYTDDHTGKSTLFMYVPKGFYIYDEANASLVYTGLNFSSPISLSGIVTLGDSIINAILQCQDFWNISADILNAYGSDILSVSPLPVDYLVLPTFDLEVLSQIQNAIILPEVSTTQNVNDITQDANGQIIYNPRISTGTTAPTVYALLNKKDVIINMYKDDITPEDVFVATRLTPVTYINVGTTYIESCGTEIISGAVIYYFTPATGGGITTAATTFNRLVNFGNYSTSPVANDTNLGLISRLSQISYHPHVYAFSLTNVNATPTLDRIFLVGDVANFTKMSPTDLGKLHTAALFSLFNVPTLGGFKG